MSMKRPSPTSFALWPLLWRRTAQHAGFVQHLAGALSFRNTPSPPIRFFRSQALSRKRHISPFGEFELRPPDRLSLFSTVEDSTGVNWDEDSSAVIGESVSDTDKRGPPDALEEEADSPIMKEYTQWCKCVEKALTGFEKKERSLRNELEKAEKIEETVSRAQLIVNNLYLFPSPKVKAAIVCDWENEGKEVELTISEKYDSASEEADALFASARKLKRGAKVVGELLIECEKSLKILRDAQQDLIAVKINDLNIDEVRLRLVQATLRRTGSKTNFQPPSDQQNASKENASRSYQQKHRSIMETSVRKLVSPAGSTVYVGRNKRGNEHLSMQFARGNDVWMHARGCPGAHVIIQNRRGSSPVTQECMEFAANLAIFYSDARNEAKFDVSVAEPKHVLKPRGAGLGAVKLREEKKVISGRPNQVPEELKLARGESGQSDEYHTADKAKHRRRTNEAAKQLRSKKRAEQRAKRKRRKRLDSD